MNKAFIFLTLFCVTAQKCSTTSPHVIVCPLESYPQLPSQTKNIKKDWSVSKKQTQGVYGSYFGYLSCSNPSGELIFPRKQTDTTFTLVITDKIKPVIMLGNTLSSLQIPEKATYDYYIITQKNDSQTKLTFWDVQKATLPKDRNLPLNSIIVFAKPEHVFISPGVTVIPNPTAQLKLPTLFIKDSIQLADNALSVLPIRHFFEPVQRTFKTEKAGVQSKIVGNNA